MSSPDLSIVADADLIARALAEDPSAASELFARWTTPVFRFVRRYVQQSASAEDITQDALIKAWRSLPSFDRSRSFKTWLFTIARNTALDHIKRKRPALFAEYTDEEGHNFLEDTLADPDPLPDELMQRLQDGQLLERALARIAPMYRQVILLHYKEDMTLAEVAETLGLPLNTVKSQHRRGLRALRKILVDNAPKSK